MNIIEGYDFRYCDTLRIWFHKPLGIGSYGHDDIDKLTEFVNEDENKNSLEVYLKYQKLEDEINDIIINNLFQCKLLEENLMIDWRDDYELEVHNIDQNKFNINIIQKLDKDLSEL